MNLPRHASVTKPPLWMVAFGLIASVLMLACCEDQVAGTSVGTGNPTEIQVSFRDDSDRAVSLTGALRIYASTQVPVSGYRPEPLLTVPLSGSVSASLKPVHFSGLTDSLWPQGSISEGVLWFNVVILGADRGAILSGLGYRKATADFIVKAQTEVSLGQTGIATRRLRVAPLVAFRGSVDTAAFSPALDYHLFLYGTGFTAKVNHGAFEIPGMPDGSYQAFLLSLPKPDGTSSGGDSATVFETSAALQAVGSQLSRGTIHARIALPDSLLPH